MFVNINCVFFERGGYCKNDKIKRSLFGFGPRCCVDYDEPFSETCKIRKEHKRPPAPPPPPPKKG